MMFRSAMNRIEAHSESTIMIGDRMDTDVVAGIEAGLETILVLSGSTTATTSALPVPAQPDLPSIADVIELCDPSTAPEVSRRSVLLAVMVIARDQERDLRRRHPIRPMFGSGHRRRPLAVDRRGDSASHEG